MVDVEVRFRSENKTFLVRAEAESILSEKRGTQGMGFGNADVKTKKWMGKFRSRI